MSADKTPFRGRRDELRGRLGEAGVASAFLVSPPNVYYFSGFHSDPHERLLALFLSTTGDEALICPALDAQEARECTDVETVSTYQDHEDPFEALATHWSSATGRSLGIEKGALSVKRWEQLRSALPQVESGFDLASDLDVMRSVKSEHEVALIREAVRIAEKSLEEAMNRFTAGMAERDLAAEIEYRMKRYGAMSPAFGTIVLAGKRSALPHGKPGMTEAQAGDFLLVDLGVFANGYCSDITRTFIVGEGSQRQRSVYEAVLEAERQAIKAIEPGRAVGEIDRAAREVIDTAGYGEHFLHRVGHGMGIEPHEGPSMHQANTTPLTPGMVFTIEPGIYLPDLGGVRIEDDLLVTENGGEALTSYPKEMTQLR